jgi:hypothetical protein
MRRQQKKKPKVGQGCPENNFANMETWKHDAAMSWSVPDCKRAGYRGWIWTSTSQWSEVRVLCDQCPDPTDFRFEPHPIPQMGLR